MHCNVVLKLPTVWKVVCIPQRSMDEGMNMPRVNEKIYWLDERPMELLTPKERQERFDREVGDDLAKLSEVDIEKLKKAYMLEG